MPLLVAVCVAFALGVLVTLLWLEAGGGSKAELGEKPPGDIPPQTKPVPPEWRR